MDSEGVESMATLPFNVGRVKKDSQIFGVIPETSSVVFGSGAGMAGPDTVSDHGLPNVP